jgi:peroxiredoxin
MQAWEKDQGTEGSMISMFADPSGEFTKALGMEMTAEGPKSVGIIGRCKRFAMYVVDNVVQAVAIAESEIDPAGDDFPEKTLTPALLKMTTLELAQLD